MNRMIGLLVALTVVVGTSDVRASGGVALEKQSWSWSSVFGRYDKAQLRRGFQVYSEVCGSCHGLRFVAYNNLSALGFNEKQIKEIAAEKDVLAGANDDGDFLDEDGNFLTRPALPSDKFVDPYLSEKEAKANNDGAFPPDLSLMAKAKVGGPNYIYGLMTGYETEFHDGMVPPPEGKYYNRYFPGHHLSMPPPLFDDGVEYADGTPATLDQQARDVTAFLNWAAEPELDERHSLGLKVMMFLLVLTALLYGLKRRIWANVH